MVNSLKRKKEGVVKSSIKTRSKSKKISVRNQVDYLFLIMNLNNYTDYIHFY